MNIGHGRANGGTTNRKSWIPQGDFGRVKIERQIGAGFMSREISASAGTQERARAPDRDARSVV